MHVHGAIADVYRAEWGRLLSMLVARTRRLDLAEDALGEAFARASDRWPVVGVPANPAGWLYTTASRQMIARLRSEAVAGRKAPLLAVRDDRPDSVEAAGWRASGEVDDLDDLRDERLAIVLLCSHPALRPEARSALALRLVIGTPTTEIARLFLVSPTTMAARITRAKKKIVTAGIPLAHPVGDELAARLDDVCRTIYLAFTAGYTPGEGPDLLRADRAGDAVELAAVLRSLVPGAAQVQALAALLLLQHARRDARVRAGRLITLADQDRSLWRHDEIRAGLGLIATLPADVGYAEELRLQGLIAAEHSRARVASDTDWRAISVIYAELEAVTRSPVVRLNRAVAVAESDGPVAGLALLAGLDGALPHNHRLPAVRADLARRGGDIDLARSSYRQALSLCANDVERRFLADRLASL
ncbi:MAG: RNA polymerase sigma factor [Acidimicrobiales bacterium]